MPQARNIYLSILALSTRHPSMKEDYNYTFRECYLVFEAVTRGIKMWLLHVVQHIYIYIYNTNTHTYKCGD